MRIGLVGLGNMGRPMAARIRAAGLPLTVHDLRADVAREVAAECGASVAPSLAALGASSDIAVTMLPDGVAVRHAVLGPGDALRGGLAAGAIVVDMGSSSPTGTRALGATLAADGIGMLDAPVSGGVRRAVDGSLTVMVGGDPALIERCAPLFDAVGTQRFACGPLGAGHAMKALNNLVSAAGLLVAGEALLVGRRFGLDPARMLEVLNASTGRNHATENKLAQFAGETGTPAAFAAECRVLWSRAAEALGPGADHTAIVRWLETVAGTTLGDD